MFSCFTFGVDSIFEEVARGFLLYGFLKENIWVYCLLCFIVVHVIVSVKGPKIIMLA